METIKGELLTENQQVMKSAIRSKIFNQSELMKDNLLKSTEFVYSKQYPTQVIDIKGTRYLRINDSDIHEDTIDDLLSLMLGIDNLKIPEDSEDMNQIIEDTLLDSIKNNMELDSVDILGSENPIIKADEYNNLLLDDLPIKPQMLNITSTKSEEEQDADKEQELKDDETSCDMTSDAKSLGSTMYGDDSTEESSKDKTSTMEYKAEIEIEQALKDIETLPSVSEFSSKHSILSSKYIKELNKKAHRLLKAFKGSKGKVKKISPSKRICSKSMAIDKDKVYYQNKDNSGKHIKMNFLIDMSGSMSGSPVKNAVSLVYIFNQLAKQGYLTMNVLYSATGHNHVLKLPCNDSLILSLSQTGDAEGLARTVHEHADLIKHTNLICLTDGNIVDEHISKTFWSKHKIVSTGVYVNSKTKDIREFTGTLSKWFNHSLVRQNLDDLIDVLIRIGLK